MVCGLSSWLQVQYHFHNDTYPHPHPGFFALRSKREKGERNEEQVENKILFYLKKDKKERKREGRWLDKKYNQALYYDPIQRI